MFIETAPSKKSKRHRRDMLIIINRIPPLTGFALSCIDRCYKHSTPTAFGGGESLCAKQRPSEQELEHLFHSLMQRAFHGELVSE